MLRLLTLLALLSPALAQETLFRSVFDPKTDTHVEVVALFSKAPPTGYLPVRVKIANNLTIPKAIKLNFNSGAQWSGENNSTSEFFFTATAGKTLTQDILVPLAPTLTSYPTENNIRTIMSGSMGREQNNFASLSSHSAAVLLSESLFTANASALDAAWTSSSSSKSHSRGDGPFSASFNPGMLPTNWLAFSGFDSIIMTDRDWATTPASSRNAIISWLRLGGQLIIFNQSANSSHTLGIPTDLSFGTSVERPIGSDLKLDPSATIALVQKQNPNRPTNVSTTTDFQSTWPLQQLFGSQTFHYGLFIAILILFAILVGPVNLFVFAKSGQRHKLFITTPVISLAASLLLIILIIIQDGLGGSGIRRILMEVRPDGDQNAAFLHQEQFCRTGVLTRSRFTLDPASLLTPVVIGDSRWARISPSNDNKGNFNLQPDDGKLTASGDWFQSRSEHGHSLTTVIPTRGRIESTAKPNSLISTFDFPIQKLLYLDPKNQWFRAENITSGKSFQLTPIEPEIATAEIQSQATSFNPRNQKILERLSSRTSSFIAITQHSPGIATHPGIRWKNTHTILTGPLINP